MRQTSLQDVTIESRGPVPAVYFRELWQYRELLRFLAVRDIKVKYKQTVLGGLWAVLQPFLSMVVFTIFFGHLTQIPSDEMPYPIFVYTALLPWQFFSNGISNAGNSLVASSNLISKVYFPRLIIPTASLGAGLIDFFVAFILLIGMMVYYGIHPGIQIILFPFLLLFAIIATLGVGLILSALNVAYRDFRHAIPFLVQFWLFATPVIYPASIVPEAWRWLLNLNPMAGLISAFRSSLLDQTVLWQDLAISAAVSLALLLLGIWYFAKTERRFADII
jgi:lipopolysaccharide transport system permease protein